MKKLVLRHSDTEALLTDFEQNLRKGRAFVAGPADFGERERCELVLIHPANQRELSFKAEAVWVGSTGVGLEVLNFDSNAKQQLSDFVKSHEAPAETPGPEPAVSDEEESDPDATGSPVARNVHERVRGLSIRERDELARRGSLPERTALERAYGGAVWEGLLQNPQLTPPEVARIAKNGTLPKPLIATIVNNGSWVTSPEVQRALLSNPRCSGPQLERVLRAMRPGELQRLAQQCPYRAEVRATALRLVGKT